MAKTTINMKPKIPVKSLKSQFVNEPIVSPFETYFHLKNLFCLRFDILGK